MPEQGLAAQQAGIGEVQQTPSSITLEQVMQALVAGATPEELVQAGVPVELIKRAMQMINSQTQPAPEEAGLAAMSLDNTMVAE
jgi:hypothetical protein